MTKQELSSLCAKWQKTLRLQDWEIYLEICRAWDMPPSVSGNNKIDILKKKSVIAILDEIDHSPHSAWPYDAEKTLVHELLHLHFETNDTITGAQYVAFEQGIDILARVLVDLKKTTDNLLTDKKAGVDFVSYL